MEKRRSIVFSGLSAAGKTTHAKLLAAELDLPYYSASSFLTKLASERAHKSVDWGDGRWSPQVDAVRAQSDIDDEVDRQLTTALRETDGAVFDGCFLPWLYEVPDVINIWIESDEPSRIRKCVVSHRSGLNLANAECETVLREKDRFSRAYLLGKCRKRFSPTAGRFDVVADNSDLIPQATVACSERGVRLFHSDLSEAVVDLLKDPALRAVIGRARVEGRRVS